MRSRAGLHASVLVFALALATDRARAQSSLDAPYTEGFALNVFEPAPAGDRFFGVSDASSMVDGKLRAGLVGDFATGTLIERTDDATGRKAAIVSKEIYVHAGLAYPITDFLHAHVSVPFAAHRSADTAAVQTGGALGDIRLGLRANVVPAKVEAFAFGPAVDVWLPTGSEDHLTGDGSPRMNAKLGISGRAGAFVYAANGGYLVRKKLDAGSLETGDAFTFGAAAGVVLFEKVQIGPEIFGNHQVSPKWNDTKITPVSALFGVKAQLGDFAVGAAAGPGLSEAPGVTPRVVVSLAFAPETHVHVSASASTEPAATEPERNEPPAPVAPPPPADSDGDGVEDAKDACPDKLGDRSDDPAKNGCPAPRIADGDGDGVRDEIDACPDVVGVATSDPKTNGCPEKAIEPPKAVVQTHVASASGGPADVTFAGFQVQPDGSSRLVVQLTAVPEIEAKSAGKNHEYVLRGARVPAANNRNPLIASHFSAEVVQARLVPGPVTRGKGGKKVPVYASLVITTREAVTPTHRVAQNPDGTATLTIDFPRPKTTPPPEPLPKAPPKKADPVYFEGG